MIAFYCPLPKNVQKCSRIKHNSFYRTLNTSRQTSPKTTQNLALSLRESIGCQTKKKIKKLQEAKKKIQHISKQNSYVQRKIEAVMNKFDDEDNSDFQHMFKLIDKNEIPEDLLLFHRAP